jgi:hypothetical protein
MKNIPSIGVQIPNILLPKEGIDLTRWAVIACDQFTSEPEYWEQVKKITNGIASSYEMILPEVMLDTPEELPRIQSTQKTMQDYLDRGLLKSREGLILVERTVSGKTRKGIMLALDLERYDFNKGSSTLIRATEGTILDRLPPRIRIREGAPLELPHILVLIDDPQRTVIEPVFEQRNKLQRLYDFDLMLESGHLKGYHINQLALENQVVNNLERLADPESFKKRYQLHGDEPVLLFALGDGNHSFATAKAIWEKIKSGNSVDHPARYALVEIENIHDDGLEFEPIHRVLFRVKQDLPNALLERYGDDITLTNCENLETMQQEVLSSTSEIQKIGVVEPSGLRLLTFRKPAMNLPVGSLQYFLDDWQKSGGFEKIDYVHGWDSIYRLSHEPGNLGFYLPVMKKTDLFKTVILEGALPRKTFSMGEAREKRFYMESRKITW